MPWYAFLLAPFALIFRVITDVRNWLFDRRVLNSYESPTPTLVVGNLNVGGTGKTPMVEFLLRNLRTEYQIAALSRGYGRKTKGFAQANSRSSAAEIGDEPLQIYQKFEGEIPVYVGEDRVAALDQIKQLAPQSQLVLLDDAFQHRRLRADFYCLLTRHDRLFSRDFVLPMGRLRESRAGASRADVVVVTKCPESLSASERKEISQELKSYLKEGVPVIFSKIRYGTPRSIEHVEPFSPNVILVSGLADDRPFVSYCKGRFKVLEVLSFPDHYDYGDSEVSVLSRLLGDYRKENPVLLTTEKDAVKLKSLANRGFLGEIPIFVMPIEAQFDSEDKHMLFNIIREKFSNK